MISTLTSIEKFKTKAIELGFDLPVKPQQYKVDIWSDNPVVHRRDKNMCTQKDKVDIWSDNPVVHRRDKNMCTQKDNSSFQEFRLVKTGEDGSTWFFLGVFYMANGRTIRCELSNKNSTGYSGFSLSPQQKEWLDTPGGAKVVFGKIQYDEFGEVIINDGISDQSYTQLKLTGIGWFLNPKLSIVIPRR